MKRLAVLLAMAGWSVWGFAAGQSAGAPAAPAAAAAPQVHQHDLARLRIAIEEDLLNLWFWAPLDSLIGFEASPRTARQQQAIKDLAARLHQPEALFVPAAAAQCVPVSVALGSEAIEQALLAAPPPAVPPPAVPPPAVPPPGEPGEPARRRPTAAAATSEDPDRRKPVAGKSQPVHADLEARISFRCGKPQSLTGLQVRLFDVFPELGRIDVDIATPRGESGARLSPNRTTLTW